MYRVVSAVDNMIAYNKIVQGMARIDDKSVKPEGFDFQSRVIATRSCMKLKGKASCKVMYKMHHEKDIAKRLTLTA